MKRYLSFLSKDRLPARNIASEADSATLSALFVPAAWAAAVFAGVICLLLGAGDLFRIFFQAVCRPVIFIPAAISAVCVFFFLLFRKRPLLSCLCCGMLLVLLVGYLYTLFTHPLPLIQLVTLRDEYVAKQRQQTKPVFEPAQKVGDAMPSLYFETGSKQAMPSQKEQPAIAHMIEELPDVLTSRAAGIYFLSEDSFKKAIASQDSFNAAGFSSSSDFSIVIKVPDLDLSEYWTYFRDGTSLSLSSPESYRETLVHELTHLVDVQTEGPSLRLSSSPEWKDIYKANREILGPYGATNPIEFFAETGVFYFLYPHLLETMAPELYNFFSLHFPQEADGSDSSNRQSSSVRAAVFPVTSKSRIRQTA